MSLSFLVADEFLVDPEGARADALRREFSESPWYKGLRTSPADWSEEIDRKLRALLGAPGGLEYHGSSWCYHATLAGVPEVYHADTGLGEWGAVLYLTPGAPVESGTSLWRHRRTGRTTGDPGAYSDRPGPWCYLDRTEWDETDFAGNVWNRMVIFRADRVHAMRRPFGWSPATGRLTQLFFVSVRR